MNAHRSTAPDPGPGQTMRLVCEDCGAVDDGQGPVGDLLAHLPRSYGFEPRSAEVTVFGLCRHCRPS